MDGVLWVFTGVSISTEGLWNRMDTGFKTSFTWSSFTDWLKQTIMFVEFASGIKSIM